MLTQSFLPTQRALARQAVVRAATAAAAAATAAAARGDVKHHLLQVHHRLAEEAEGLQVAPRRLLVTEARLALAADQLVLHLWNNEGVVEGVRTFAKLGTVPPSSKQQLLCQMVSSRISA